MKSFEYFLLGLFIGGLFSILVYSFIMLSQPSAMDVHEGKTTIEYKIIDSVKIDSVIVFKKNNI